MRKMNLCFALIFSAILVGCGQKNAVSLDEYTNVVEERESLRTALNNSVPKEEYDAIIAERDTLKNTLQELQNKESATSMGTEPNEYVSREEYDKIVRERDELSLQFQALQTNKESQQNFHLADYWTCGHEVLKINDDKTFIWYQYPYEYKNDNYYIQSIFSGTIDDYTIYVTRQYYPSDRSKNYTLEDLEHLDNLEYKETNQSYVISMMTSNVFVLYKDSRKQNKSYTRQKDYVPAYPEPLHSSKDETQTTPTSEETNIIIHYGSSNKTLNLAGMSDSNGYLCSWADSDYITENELQGIEYDTARLVLNEIFARHGRKFNDTALSEYFNSKTWYQGTVEPNDFTDSVLNDYEKANIALLTDYMEKIKAN